MGELENKRLALKEEKRRLGDLLDEERLKYHQGTVRWDEIPRYSKLFFVGQVLFFIVLLISVLPNVSFLLDQQPMKKGAFTVTAVCMTGLLILLIMHIVLNVKYWIDDIRRKAALDRLQKETAKRILDIEKELQECREVNKNVYPDYEFVGDEWKNLQ